MKYYLNGQYYAVKLILPFLITLLSISDHYSQQAIFDGVSTYFYISDTGSDVYILARSIGDTKATFENETNGEDCTKYTDNLTPNCGSFENCIVDLDFTSAPSNVVVAIGVKYSSWTDNNMVSALDLSIIQSHILRINPFYSMFQYIAADAVVDLNNNVISTLDLVQLQKCILGLETPTSSSVPPWTFFDGHYIQSPLFPFFIAMDSYNPSDKDYDDFRSAYPLAFNQN